MVCLMYGFEMYLDVVSGTLESITLKYICYTFQFLGGLLSTAQSYPSLSGGNNSGSVTNASGGTQSLGQTLTMSLTSTSSDSEQVSFINTIFHNRVNA